MSNDDLHTFNAEQPDPIVPLLQKLLAGEPLAGEEQAQLEAWSSASEHNRALLARLRDPAAVQQMLRAWHGIEKGREQGKMRGMHRLDALLSERRGPARRLRFLRGRVVRYAAAVILLLSAGVYLYKSYNIENHQPAGGPPVVAGPVAPGREGAVLTLADGSAVVLDSLENGVVATQGGAQVLLQNGQLAYGPAGGAGQAAWNTISTPKGRQFRLQLPDGSRVWLNAASSVRYPTAFSGEERRVILAGEAYFEVTANAEKPFRVDLQSGAQIEVLGTSFNINSYQNESAIRTTLLEGAVSMRAFNRSQTLKPGQQAVADPVKKQLALAPHADLQKVMAWKNGLFNFDDASLEEVMRQLERWYNIEVVYAKGVPVARFGGEINKQNTLQDVLQILEKSGVHFRLEDGRKLVVMP